MSSPDALEQLTAHLAWADARVLRALRQASPLPPHALELYGHVLGAEHVWLSRINGSAASVAVWPDLSLTQCEALAADNAQALAVLAEPRAAKGRDSVISYTNSAGDRFTNTVQEIVLHICLHGTYHRGQISLILRQAGLAPQASDYIELVRGVPAAKRK